MEALVLTPRSAVVGNLSDKAAQIVEHFVEEDGQGVSHLTADGFALIMKEPEATRTLLRKAVFTQVRSRNAQLVY